MNKCISLLLFFALCGNSFAQQSDSTSRTKFPHFTVFAEAGGSALFYSVNTEFFISNNRTVNFNLRAGIGYIDSDEILAPFLFNTIIGRKKSKLECGIGILIESRAPAMAGTIGYRHQSDNGLFYRIAFTPLYSRYANYNFLPTGGLSLGYFFGYSKTKRESKPLANLDSADNKLNLIIKADILSPILLTLNQTGYGSLTIEKGLKRRFSVQLTGTFSSYVTKDYHADTLWNYHKNNRFQIIPEGKYFWGKRRYYSGFYSGLYAKYEYSKSESKWFSYNNQTFLHYNGNRSYVAGGIIIGYQNYIIKRRMVLDILAGAGYFSRNIIHFSDAFRSNEIDIRFALNIGYRF